MGLLPAAANCTHTSNQTAVSMCLERAILTGGTSLLLYTHISDCTGAYVCLCVYVCMRVCVCVCVVCVCVCVCALLYVYVCTCVHKLRASYTAHLYCTGTFSTSSADWLTCIRCITSDKKDCRSEFCGARNASLLLSCCCCSCCCCSTRFSWLFSLIGEGRFGGEARQAKLSSLCVTVTVIAAACKHAH